MSSYLLECKKHGKASLAYIVCGGVYYDDLQVAKHVKAKPDDPGQVLCAGNHSNPLSPVYCSEKRSVVMCSQCAAQWIPS